jgi:hypothetical protein
MEDTKDMSIGDLRRNLADRLDAAFFRGEATVIRNARRSRPTAALVPYPWLEELYDLREEVVALRAKADAPK